MPAIMANSGQRLRVVMPLVGGVLSAAVLGTGLHTHAAEGNPHGIDIAQLDRGSAAGFRYPTSHLPGKKPWTDKPFRNNPRNFQFVIIGDRTGGANAEKTFERAIEQINLLQPEFVINVGDTIEGYSDDPKELQAEWNEFDAVLRTLQMPFFRTPGNHDIANDVASTVWNERYGKGYYHFIYGDTLFIVLNSEDTPRSAPPGMKEKIDLYNRLQTEAPPRLRPCSRSSWQRSP